MPNTREQQDVMLQRVVNSLTRHGFNPSIGDVKGTIRAKRTPVVVRDGDRIKIWIDMNSKVKGDNDTAATVCWQCHVALAVDGIGSHIGSETQEHWHDYSRYLPRVYVTQVFDDPNDQPE